MFFLLLTVAHGFILLTRSVILSVFSAHPAMPFINVNYWTRRFLRSLTILEERTLWEPYNKHWKYYRTQENKQHVQYFSSQVSRICTVTYFLHRTYYVQIQPKQTVRGITYVCTERIFDSRLLMYNKIFLKISYRSLCFTSLRFFKHLLRPNWSTIRGKVTLWFIFENREIALIEAKCRRFRNSSECLKIHRASKNWPIGTL